MCKKVIITTGDPNGIGAEVTVKALKNFNRNDFFIISNRKVLGFEPDFEIELDKIEPSKITKEGGEFSYQALKKACELVKSGGFSAIVTAPVAKEALHLADHNFSGQTEILEKYLAHNGQKAEMLFVANNFRVLLLTRHVALKEIHLTKELVIKKVLTAVEFLSKNQKIKNPKLALCAFNPHAGENGLFGTEEQEILIPAVKELKKMGVNITEPLPADTLFVKAGKNFLKSENVPFDCYIACYHDQGLIPIKTLASDCTVNTTIGLDIIRTSPAHGTAFDIAGQGIADEKSMTEAIRQALEY
ncbi:4-hydroxythreonine-4-phosphate dehydrogenase PdxA [bacterium]|nr:4-hydroxythreonine-4-phosphate dehydrogenase PdxA [bacterium]